MIELSQAWRKACEYLTEKLGNPSFATWIQPLKPTARQETITLEAPDAFFKDWVRLTIKLSGSPAMGNKNKISKLS